MSPFADALRGVRYRKGLRQQDLAQLLGCERSYVSALENDLKLAPSGDFVDRICIRLALTDAEASELRLARACSRRRYDVPVNVPPATFKLVHELFSRLDRLSEPHVIALNAMLRLSQPGVPDAAATEGRVRRRDRKTGKVGTPV